jgi:hypothetical protein
MTTSLSSIHALFSYSRLRASHQLYVITDGISSIQVGSACITQSSGSGSGSGSGSECDTASLMYFDWSKGQVSTKSANRLVIPSDTWCTPSDQEGSEMTFLARVLWTVNGRVMYRKCGSNIPGDLTMVLGGSMHDPMSKADVHVFKICPSDRFDCNDRDHLAADPRQYDVFAHIDQSGFLHFMDYGGKHALFGCNSSELYGLVRTSIEVGPAYSNDFELPANNVLTWADGDASSKNISLQIIKDGQVDSGMWENLTIYLHSPSLASIDPQLQSVLVNIHDDDGAGFVTLTLNSTRGVRGHDEQIESNGDPRVDSLHPQPVAERGLCCGGRYEYGYKCRENLNSRT